MTMTRSGYRREVCDTAASVVEELASALASTWADAPDLKQMWDGLDDDTLDDEEVEEIHEEVNDRVQEMLNEMECAFDDEVHDRSWESVDGHEWIICTRYHVGIIEHTESDPVADGLVDLSGYTDLGSLHQAVAFYAFREDVNQEIEKGDALKEALWNELRSSTTPRLCASLLQHIQDELEV